GLGRERRVVPGSLSGGAHRRRCRDLRRAQQDAMIAIPRPVRLLFASATATLADAAVLVALCRLAGVSAGIAAAIGSLVGGAVNFVLNRTLVFDAVSSPWHRQAAHYAVIVVGGGAAVSGVAVAAFTAVGLPILVAKAIAV